MKQYFLIVGILFSFLNVHSQDDFKTYAKEIIKEENIVISIGQILHEKLIILNDGKGGLFYEHEGVSRAEMTKTKPVNMVLRISDFQGNNIKDIEIDFNDIDIDLSGFGIKYLGSRKFITINVGRFHRYILNLSNLKLIGPIRPHIEGSEFGDSQDGNPLFLEVFNQGQYLVGCLTGMGYFCYNLMDLYNPIQITHYCADNSILKGKYFFLDKREKDIYNGILAEFPKYKTIDTISFMFQGLRFEIDESNNIVSKNTKNRFLILQQIMENGEKHPLIIDYLNGVILNNEKDKNLINELIAK
jgi:hypothetical protein